MAGAEGGDESRGRAPTGARSAGSLLECTPPCTPTSPGRPRTPCARPHQGRGAPTGTELRATERQRGLAIVTVGRPRRLYLLRHAKSSWADDRLDDHDRPLAKRGEDAVVRLRHYVATSGMAPELVLCSSARRTVMTLEGIASALPDDTTVLVEAGLYGAPSGGLLARLRDVGDDVASVLLIGHNPGLETLASLLIGDGEEDPRRRVATKFPTGALAVLTFDGGWSNLAPAAATLDAFVVPRDL